MTSFQAWIDDDLTRKTQTMTCQHGGSCPQLEYICSDDQVWINMTAYSEEMVDDLEHLPLPILRQVLMEWKNSHLPELFQWRSTKREARQVWQDVCCRDEGY